MKRAILTAAALTLYAAPSLEGQSTTHRLSGNSVSVYNLAGVVRVERGDGSDVEVQVSLRGPDAGQLRVETGDVRGRQALRVIYPDERLVYRSARTGSRFRTQVHVRRDGTFGGGSDWDGSRRIEITSDGRGMEAAADLVIRVPRGKSLDLNLGVGEATATNVEGDLSIDVHAASITTRGTRGTLILDTGSGEVSVTDATGELELDTGSGSVTLDRISGPSLTLDTGSGAIEGTNIEAPVIRLDTGSGRVRLRRVTTRDVSLDTGSGSVDVDLASDVERFVVDAGSGRITIGVPESLGAELVVESGSGGIDMDIPVEVRRAGRRSLHGTIGDGRGRIEIDTGSGGVRVRRSGSS